MFDEVLCRNIEQHLGINKPVFLYDYPVELGSLARQKNEDGSVAERFELYIAGIELANGFTELTDARVQRRRFDDENRIRAGQGKQKLPLPKTFLSELDTMPPAAGIALGAVRVVDDNVEVEVVD